MAKYEIAVDLGSANITIFQKGAGLVLREPSVVAGIRHKNKFEITETGFRAKNLLTRELGDSRLVYPIKEGIVADIEVAGALLKDLIGRIIKENALTKRIRAIVLISTALTEPERKDVEKAFLLAGVKDVLLVESPLALLALTERVGALFVDIGAGKTEVASVTKHGIASGYSVNIAGNAFNKEIIDLVEKRYCIKIGDYTAERVKLALASLYDNDRGETEVSGRGILDGAPKTVNVLSSDLRDAIRPLAENLVEVVECVLSATPPELAAEIGRKGVVLAGGSSALPGLTDFLSSRLSGMPINFVEDIESGVAIGGGKLLSDKTLLSALLGIKNI